MAWVAVAIGGAALIGGAASVIGSNKQANASNQAAQMSQDQAAVNRADQLPYIQSGYGALGKLNTLMGINADPTSIKPQTTSGTGGPWAAPQIPQPPGMMTPGEIAQRPLSMSSQNPQLRQLLQIRADNGDAQASQMLGLIK